MLQKAVQKKGTYIHMYIYIHKERNHIKAALKQ